MSRLSARTTGDTGYCAFCAQHNHRHCTGRSSLGGECGCGAREHRPTTAVAAAMQRYVAPDRAKVDDVELANEWHRADEARIARTARTAGTGRGA